MAETCQIVPIGGRVFILKSDESQFKHKSKVIYVIWILTITRREKGSILRTSSDITIFSRVFNTIIDLIKTFFFYVINCLRLLLSYILRLYARYVLMDSIFCFVYFTVSKRP